MGDLHLAEEMIPHFFHPARDDALRALNDDQSNCERLVVQVGDLGAYEADPGSTACFKLAKDYLDGFRGGGGARVRLVTGNHDLEGAEFDALGDAEEADAANLAAWRSIFGEHYWSDEVGSSWLAIGMSTTRFRSNANSCHEVFIDDTQREWLVEVLRANAQQAPERRRKVVIFTHAPPAGCGLRVLHSVHVKNRCAWLNHSSGNVGWFFDEVVSAFGDDVVLWFSGHFHLSHEYIDSISVVGRTAFVQCGVIGPCNRDGNRQSRLLDLFTDGYRVTTIDHISRTLRVDLEHSFDDVRRRPEPRLDSKQCFLLDRAGDGPLISTASVVAAADDGGDPGTDENDRDGGGRLMRVADACSVASSRAGKDAADTWLSTGRSELHVQHDAVVEYDPFVLAPIGLVHTSLAGRSVRLVDADGRCVAGSGARAAFLEIVNADGGIDEAIPRNSSGFFFRVFQPNKWRKKRQAARSNAEANAEVDAEANAEANAEAAGVLSVVGDQMCDSASVERQEVTTKNV